MEFSTEETQIQHWLKLIERFYETFGWLADSFMLDFHVESHWEKLPKSWQSHLTSMDQFDLASWLFNEKTDKPITKRSTSASLVPPLGLLAFRKVISILSFPRQEISTETYINLIRNFCPVNRSPENQFPRSIGPEKFGDIFKKHVKLKKRHEIQKLSQIISCCTDSTNTNDIVDIGSGLGHLSRYLFHGFDLNLTCVDCSEFFTSSAKKLDDAVNSRLSQFNAIFENNNDTKLKPKFRKDKPIHLTMRLEMDQEVNLVDHESYGFVGLHTCGDLGPLILTTYANSPKARFVVSVGCCFMKLGNQGFPLSTFMKKKMQLNLSYQALELACHAIEDYVEKLNTSNYVQLKIHNYRATLEFLIAQKYPHLRHSGLKGIRNFEAKGFKQYVREATSSLSLDFGDNLLESEYVKSMLDDWWKVVTFYSLRLLMANVVETAVVLDRLLYLRENGHHSTVIPVFNPKISPRNFAVVAIKHFKPSCPDFGF